MLSSRVSSALFVFFCFVIMTDEVLTTPDEVSELKSKIASLNEQVAKLTKTSSTNNLDEAELGEEGEEELRAGLPTPLTPNAVAVLAAEEAVQRKAQSSSDHANAAGTFNWTQCTSEGGLKNCAKCKEADGNGALPCDKPLPTKQKNTNKASNCPDSKLWNGKFYSVNEISGKGVCESLGRPACFRASALTTYNFAGGIYNSSADLLDKNLVSTKCFITHPTSASANVGVVIFKRLVMHQCTGIRPAFCKKGDNVADVYKQGFCVKCKPKEYDREGCGKKGKKCEVFSCGAWGTCNKKGLQKTLGTCKKGSNCFGFKPKQYSKRRLQKGHELVQRCNIHGNHQKTGKRCGGFGTEEEKKAFLNQCLKDAFTSKGILKDDYQCSDKDMMYAKASIATF